MDVLRNLFPRKIIPEPPLVILPPASTVAGITAHFCFGYPLRRYTEGHDLFASAMTYQAIGVFNAIYRWNWIHCFLSFLLLHPPATYTICEVSAAGCCP